MIEEGMCLYSIEADNCLNGVYTNEHPSVAGKICNEIAIIRDKMGEDGITGIYDAVYFDPGNVRVDATLEITSKGGRILRFRWHVGKKPLFEGVGYKMNEKQITVHYWELP